MHRSPVTQNHPSVPFGPAHSVPHPSTTGRLTLCSALHQSNAQQNACARRCCCCCCCSGPCVHSVCTVWGWDGEANAGCVPMFSYCQTKSKSLEARCICQSARIRERARLPEQHTPNLDFSRWETAGIRRKTGTHFICSSASLVLFGEIKLMENTLCWSNCCKLARLSVSQWWVLITSYNKLIEGFRMKHLTHFLGL